MWGENKQSNTREVDLMGVDLVESYLMGVDHMAVGFMELTSWEDIKWMPA